MLVGSIPSAFEAETKISAGLPPIGGSVCIIRGTRITHSPNRAVRPTPSLRPLIASKVIGSFVE